MLSFSNIVWDVKATYHFYHILQNSSETQVFTFKTSELITLARRVWGRWMDKFINEKVIVRWLLSLILVMCRSVKRLIKNIWHKKIHYRCTLSNESPNLLPHWFLIGWWMTDWQLYIDVRSQPRCIWTDKLTITTALTRYSKWDGPVNEGLYYWAMEEWKSDYIKAHR